MSTFFVLLFQHRWIVLYLYCNRPSHIPKRKDSIKMKCHSPFINYTNQHCFIQTAKSQQYEARQTLLGGAQSNKERANHNAKRIQKLEPFSTLACGYFDPFVCMLVCSVLASHFCWTNKYTSLYTVKINWHNEPLYRSILCVVCVIEELLLRWLIGWWLRLDCV